MAKRPRAVDGSEMDPHIAAQAGWAFFQQSQGFVGSLPSDPACTDAVVSMGDLIASATSLALSAELFLKALLILRGSPVPTSHDLLGLWEALPEPDKQLLREDFESRRATEPGAAVTIRLAFAPSEADCTSELPAGTGEHDNSLEAVLGRSRYAFCSWRYLHEITQSAGVAVIDYEYHQLAVVVLAVSDRCHGLMFGETA